MTVKDFEKLSDEEKNKMVAEAMGYEYVSRNNEEAYFKKEGIIYNVEDVDFMSAEGLKEMLEWCREDYIIDICFYNLEWSVCLQIQNELLCRKIIGEASNPTLNFALYLAILKSAGRIEEE